MKTLLAVILAFIVGTSAHKKRGIIDESLRDGYFKHLTHWGAVDLGNLNGLELQSIQGLYNPPTTHFGSGFIKDYGFGVEFPDNLLFLENAVNSAPLLADKNLYNVKLSVSLPELQVKPAFPFKLPAIPIQSTSPAPTNAQPPPPNQPPNQPPPTVQGGRLGSGSLGYTYLGNGLYALGSGSLGFAPSVSTNNQRSPNLPTQPQGITFKLPQTVASIQAAQQGEQFRHFQSLALNQANTSPVYTNIQNILLNQQLYNSHGGQGSGYGGNSLTSLRNFPTRPSFQLNKLSLSNYGLGPFPRSF